VAGFIGSPAMNFVTADWPRRRRRVTFAGYKLEVPPSCMENKPGLADYFGKKVILGIRPSDFDDAAWPPANGAPCGSPRASPRSSAARST
jgi:multiple sugar transport system ATP-binding protein